MRPASRHLRMGLALLCLAGCWLLPTPSSHLSRHEPAVKRSARLNTYTFYFYVGGVSLQYTPTGHKKNNLTLKMNFIRMILTSNNMQQGDQWLNYERRETFLEKILIGSINIPVSMQ